MGFEDLCWAFLGGGNHLHRHRLHDSPVVLPPQVTLAIAVAVLTIQIVPRVKDALADPPPGAFPRANRMQRERVGFGPRRFRPRVI